MHRWWRLAVLAILTTSVAGQVMAQGTIDAEEEEIRRELQEISKSDHPSALKAKEALNALAQPRMSPVGQQIRGRRERGERRIVNGISTPHYAAVAGILKGNDQQTAKIWCSGTLIACNMVLTAAHCIEHEPSAEKYIVFFQHAGFFKVRDIVWPKAEYKFPFADLAILTLDQPVERISPVPLNTIGKPIDGWPGVIVGYGRTGGIRYDYGIKREGSIITGTCSANDQQKKLLCWNFDADVKLPGHRANTCNADSGGAVFIVSGREQMLAGVVSGGLDKNCLKGDYSYNSDVYEYQRWIKAAAGDFSGAPGACGIGAPIDTTKHVVFSKKLRLDALTSVREHSINVPSRVGVLRIAMNGSDDGEGSNDFDLHVYQGSKRICAEDGSGQFGFCEVKQPAAGVYKIRVSRKKGAGDIQVTVSVLPNDR